LRLPRANRSIELALTGALGMEQAHESGPCRCGRWVGSGRDARASRLRRGCAPAGRGGKSHGCRSVDRGDTEVGTLAQVPWAQVGPGWALAEYTAFDGDGEQPS
jgi:hypothetical protein